MVRCNVKVMATQDAYTDIHPTLVLMACNLLEGILCNRARKAKNKGEEVVEVNGNRIALLYEIKRHTNDDGDDELIAEVRKARYTRGRGQVRPIYQRKA